MRVPDGAARGPDVRGRRDVHGMRVRADRARRGWAGRNGRRGRSNRRGRPADRRHGWDRWRHDGWQLHRNTRVLRDVPDPDSLPGGRLQLGQQHSHRVLRRHGLAVQPIRDQGYLHVCRLHVARRYPAGGLGGSQWHGRYTWDRPGGRRGRYDRRGRCDELGRKHRTHRRGTAEHGRNHGQGGSDGQGRLGRHHRRRGNRGNDRHYRSMRQWHARSR